MVKRIAVINDLSGMGKCSLTAALPVISVMGVQACPLPTAILSNQTDYESYYAYDYTKHINKHIAQWKKMNLSFDGIYTGYLGSESQVKMILEFIREFRKLDTLLLVDPVMGDSGKPYDVFTPYMGKQMKKLAFMADVITPNLTELCILTDTNYDSLIVHENSPDYLEKIAKIGKALLKKGIHTVIITGISYNHHLYNLVLEKGSVQAVVSEVHGGSRSGTGDLLASIVAAGMIRGETAIDCVRLAARFLEKALIETVNEEIDRNDGVNFEPYLGMLIKRKEVMK